MLYKWKHTRCDKSYQTDIFCIISIKAGVVNLPISVTKIVSSFPYFISSFFFPLTLASINFVVPLRLYFLTAKEHNQVACLISFRIKSLHLHYVTYILIQSDIFYLIYMTEQLWVKGLVQASSSEINDLNKVCWTVVEQEDFFSFWVQEEMNTAFFLPYMKSSFLAYFMYFSYVFLLCNFSPMRYPCSTVWSFTWI